MGSYLCGVRGRTFLERPTAPGTVVFTRRPSLDVSVSSVRSPTGHPNWSKRIDGDPHDTKCGSGRLIRTGWTGPTGRRKPGLNPRSDSDVLVAPMLGSTLRSIPVLRVGYPLPPTSGYVGSFRQRVLGGSLNFRSSHKEARDGPLKNY